MAHNLRTRTPDANWNTGQQPAPADLWDLDRKIANSIDGVNGGTWSIKGGNTMGIAGSGLQVTGPLVIQGAGALLETFGGGSGIQILGPTHFPRLATGHPGRTRRLPHALLTKAVWNPSYAWGTYRGKPTPDAPEVFGLQSAALALKNWDGTITTPEFRAQLRVHDGGTLQSVTLYLRVPALRSAAPAIMPKLRVFARDQYGNVTLLKSTTPDVLGFTADANGFVSIGTNGTPTKPQSADAWYAGGAAQSVTYLCDQNNVVDIGHFNYFVHVVEESLGPSASSAAYPLAAVVMQPVVSAVGVAPSGTLPIAIDGVSCPAGTRFLIYPTSPLATAPGIWNVIDAGGGTAGYVRSPDLAQASQFHFGALIPVQLGLTYDQTCWQITTPEGSVVLSSTPITMTQPPTLNGNVYHTAVAQMAITDTRWE